MNKLNDNELYKINGGSVTSTLINSVVAGCKLLYNIGVSLGSSLRRLIDNKMCSI